MHPIHVITLFAMLSLVGVELSVSAFVHPAAAQLDPTARQLLLSRFASTLGKVMPIWYPVCAVLLGVETWLHWRVPGKATLLAADTIWLTASLASVLFLVPLNTRIAHGAANWQQLHRTWDQRHRVRIIALAVAALLLTASLSR